MTYIGMGAASDWEALRYIKAANGQMVDLESFPYTNRAPAMIVNSLGYAPAQFANPQDYNDTVYQLNMQIFEYYNRQSIESDPTEFGYTPNPVPVSNVNPSTPSNPITATPTGNTPSAPDPNIYYNSAGDAFRPGVDTVSYWQGSTGQWYEGHTDGTVKAITSPPWQSSASNNPAPAGPTQSSDLPPTDQAVYGPFGAPFSIYVDENAYWTRNGQWYHWTPTGGIETISTPPEEVKNAWLNDNPAGSASGASGSSALTLAVVGIAGFFLLRGIFK